MVARFRNIFYFCNVKSFGRYEAAAKKQRFLYPYISVNNKRKEWGKSNRPEVSARMNLTAPTALSFINV
jgi:hypothetical protein